ncbi:MAG: glycoside hydrolase family 88 protein [bacterium]
MTNIAVEKTERNLKTLQHSFPRFPHVVREDKWITSSDEEWEKLTDGYWTPGFWIGMLWLCYAITKDEKFARAAQKWITPIEPRSRTTSLHDLGFLFYPSAVLGYEISGNEKLKKLALTAARSLLNRFQTDLGFLNLHDSPHYKRCVAIDTMMNIPLLWWAWKNSGNKDFYNAASAHAANTKKHLIRANGSTCHILRFKDAEFRDSELRIRNSGFLSQNPNPELRTTIETWQGASPQSCWSRGHAWAVAGCANAFFYTGEIIYKEIFESLLDFYLKNAPPDFVPYWDFNSPEIPNTERDSSAAAITAYGILTLCRTKKNDKSLINTAKKILRSLVENYLTPADHPAILKHVCFHKPAAIDTDCSSIFADFYFLIALHLLKQFNLQGRLAQT